MVADIPNESNTLPGQVERLIIGSYESGWGLPDGEYMTYHVAWCADTGRKLHDTETSAYGDTLDLVQRLYRSAVVVADIRVVEKGGRL